MSALERREIFGWNPRPRLVSALRVTGEELRISLRPHQFRDMYNSTHSGVWPPFALGEPSLLLLHGTSCAVCAKTRAADQLNRSMHVHELMRAGQAPSGARAAGIGAASTAALHPNTVAAEGRRLRNDVGALELAKEQVLEVRASGWACLSC